MYSNLKKTLAAQLHHFPIQGGKTVVVEPHRHEGIFIARGKEDALVTRNICVGESVYGEKRIAVESQDKENKVRFFKTSAFSVGLVQKI